MAENVGLIPGKKCMLRLHSMYSTYHALRCEIHYSLDDQSSSNGECDALTASSYISGEMWQFRVDPSKLGETLVRHIKYLGLNRRLEVRDAPSAFDSVALKCVVKPESTIDFVILWLLISNSVPR